MDIKETRSKIDVIDDQIAKLFEDRMNLAGKIGEYKGNNNLPSVNRTRERDIINRIANGVNSEYVGYSKTLFNLLFDLSRAYQNKFLGANSNLEKEITTAVANTPKMFPIKATVACQGAEGAYSQIACDKIFPVAGIMYFQEFEGVFQGVDKGLCQYGILPIENSTAGSVNEVYDLMKKYKFHIVKSLRLRVDHSLLAKKGVAIGDIKEIISHEQAISQCANTIKAMNGAKITLCENTATAARIVAESPRNDIAAISSEYCGDLYGLNILAENIQDCGSNYTRFICIAKDLEIYPGADKISLMLSIPHVPGSLYRIITRFSSLGLNLTKLESRPIPGKDFEFMFYFDIEASCYSEDVLKLLSQLDTELPQFSYLGSYSEII
ncbi:MAG: prephenate dehydratase domain-containing protein [Clostridiales bacterium]